MSALKTLLDRVEACRGYKHSQFLSKLTQIIRVQHKALETMLDPYYAHKQREVCGEAIEKAESIAGKNGK